MAEYYVCINCQRICNVNIAEHYDYKCTGCNGKLKEKE